MDHVCGVDYQRHSDSLHCRGKELDGTASASVVSASVVSASVISLVVAWSASLVPVAGYRRGASYNHSLHRKEA